MIMFKEQKMYQSQTVKIIGVGGGRAGRAPRPIIRAGRAPSLYRSTSQLLVKANNADG